MTDVLGVDPGLRTGVVLVHYNAIEPAKLLWAEDVPGGVKGFIEFFKENPFLFNEVVAEDFIYHGRPGADVRDPLMVLGAVHVLAHEMDVPLTLQPPAGRKRAVPDGALERFGFPFSGNKDRNTKEAFRHVLWYLKKRKHIPTLKAGWHYGV